jgi:hypothetical protein
LVWATLVDRLRFSFFLELAKQVPYSTPPPFYVTRSYIDDGVTPPPKDDTGKAIVTSYNTSSSNGGVVILKVVPKVAGGISYIPCPRAGSTLLRALVQN